MFLENNRKLRKTNKSLTFLSSLEDLSSPEDPIEFKNPIKFKNLTEFVEFESFFYIRVSTKKKLKKIRKLFNLKFAKGLEFLASKFEPLLNVQWFVFLKPKTTTDVKNRYFS